MFEVVLFSAGLALGAQAPPPCIPRYVDQHLIYYASGVFDLDAQRAARVRTAADYIDPGRGRVVVIGRADTEGDADYNLALSRRRAEGVAEELVRLGIPRDSIDIRARGEAEAARPTADDVAEPLNRMVHIETGPVRPSTWAALRARDCGGR